MTIKGNLGNGCISDFFGPDHSRIKRKLAGLPTQKVEAIENLGRQIAEESEFLDGPRRSAHRDHESFSESRL